MELKSNNCRHTRIMGSDMAAVLIDPEHMMQKVTPNMGLKFLSNENELSKPAAMTNRGAVQSFMEYVLAANTVTGATEDMAGTVVESYSDAIKHKLKPPSKFVVKPSTDTRSEIERILTDLDVVTKTEVKPIVETCLTKGTSTLQLQIIKTVGSTFEDAS